MVVQDGRPQGAPRLIHTAPVPTIRRSRSGQFIVGVSGRRWWLWVCVRIHQRIHHFSGRSRTGHWGIQIVHNGLMDHLCENAHNLLVRPPLARQFPRSCYLGQEGFGAKTRIYLQESHPLATKSQPLCLNSVKQRNDLVQLCVTFKNERNG